MAARSVATGAWRRIAAPERGGRAARAGGRPGTGPVDPARQAAYETVAAVHRDDAYANLVLPRHAPRAPAARPGRGVRHRADLRHAARARHARRGASTVAADREVDRIDPPARDALRLGAYQLLHTRVPRARRGVVHGRPGAGRSRRARSGFANAVLREVAEPRPGRLARPGGAAGRDDPVGHLALALRHPQWIVRAFRDALGGDRSTRPTRLLAADNERADRCTCAPGPAASTRPSWPSEVGGAPGAFSPVRGLPARRRARRPGRGPRRPGARAGRGLASWSPPRWPTRRSDGTDERWLDLCAGPGGKAALLGALAAQRGAHLTAVEVAEHRARLVAQAVRGLPVDVLYADGREVGATPTCPRSGFDRVLVDAPCTGLGALRRRPEARWRRQPSDLPPLTRLQRELLAAALRAVRPGGLVGYVTCSPHVVETQVSVTEARPPLRASRSTSSTPGRCCRPACPAWAPARPCSSGRTGTAPTRCSWRCCRR